MASSKYELTSFFKEVEVQLSNKGSFGNTKNNFQDVLPDHLECFFVVDLTNSKIVHFQGMKKVFGYNVRDIDLPFVFEKSHPEDTVMVQKIVQTIISQIIGAAIPVHTNVFSVASRFRKNSGDYIRMLTDNFILETDNNKIVKSILVRYTDISFLDHSTTVDWKVNNKYLDEVKIANEIYAEHQNLFTEREKEIILFVVSGISNPVIAEKLNISEHTIATHRKNIFSKSNCSTPEELKVFCKKNGFLHGNESLSF